MALPVLPFGLAAVAVYFLSKKGKDTRTDPVNPTWFENELPPNIRDNLNRAILDAGTTPTLWPGLIISSVQMQQQGWPVTAATLVACANACRSKINPNWQQFTSPITDAEYVRATQEAQLGR